MPKQKIISKFRINLSEKVMDLGNLAFVALVIGQFIGGKELSLALLISGVVFMLMCYIISYIVSR